MGFLFDNIFRKKDEPIRPKTSEEILNEFLETLQDLPYNEFFVGSCSDYLEEESDDNIREKLMDGYCMNVAQYLFRSIQNLGSVIRCYYMECRDGLDFHFIFYCPTTNKYYDAYDCYGVNKLSELEFTRRYNKPYKTQGYDFPGRKVRMTEEELVDSLIDCTEDAIKQELYKYCNGNMDYIKQCRAKNVQ